MKEVTMLKNLRIAHRGLYDSKIPENSMAAFARAVRAGIPIEFDVHLLKDGTIVVFHDDNLKRMTGVDKSLADCTYQEIRSLRLLKTEERIPRLEEVLDLVSGKVLLDIELKSDVRVGMLEERLVAILDCYSGDFLVKSFHPLSVLWMKRHRPDYIRGWLVMNSKKQGAFKRYVVNHLLFLPLLKPDFVAASIDFFPNRVLANYRRKGSVFVWTIRNFETLSRLETEADSFLMEGMDLSYYDASIDKKSYF